MPNLSLRFSKWLLYGSVLAWFFATTAEAQTGGPEELSEEEARQVEIAERFFTVLEKNPRRGTALDRVYGHHVEFGTLDELLAELRAKVEQSPEDGATWMLLGLFEAHRGEDGNAVEAFRSAAQHRPDDPLASYYLGQSLLLIGQPEEAVAAFEKALELEPQRADLLEIFQQLGRLHQRAQRTDEALAVWQRLEALFPDDPRVQELIAVTLVEEGQYALALPRYEKLAELVNDDYRRVVYQVEAAELKIRENRRGEGLQDLEKVLADLNPDSWLHRDVRRRIEEVFLRTGDQDGLVKYYEKWIERHAEDVDAMARLAKFLASSARVPEATQWMEKALKLAPTRIELRKSFIDQLVDEQRYSEAVAQYALLVEAAPANADFLRNWGKLVLRDKSQELEKRQQEAARIWRRIIAARPNDAVTAAQVADLFRQANMNDDATVLYQKAVELAPEEPQYREYLGEFYHVLKRPEEALATWAAIAEGPRRSAINVTRLAEVYNSFGYLDRAVTEIVAACQLDPKDFSLQLMAADYHARASKHDEALGFLSTAENLAANDEEREAILKSRIEVFQSSRRLDEEIEQMVAKVGEDQEATAEDWHVLARYYEADRRWSNAIEAIDQALAKEEKSIPALTTAARIAELSGDYAQAADRSRQLARFDRRSRSDHLMNVARLEAQMGRTEEALQAGKDLIVSAPGNTDNYEFYAQLCFRLGKMEDGLDTLRKAVRINPTEPHLITALGAALADQFRSDEAIEVYWRAFEKTDEVEDKTSLTVKLTELYLQTNQFDKLIERFKRERQEDEKRREMTICLAQAHHTSGDYGTARQELESLLSQESQDTNLLQQLSKLCEEGADFDAAIDYQRRLAEIAPGAETEFRLATLLQSRGDRDEASEIFIKLSRREENPSRLLRSLDSLLTQGSYESVIAITEPLLSQQRNDWELLYREGVAWTSLNNHREAQERFERLLKLTTPHDALGVIAEERFKRAQSKAKSDNLRGFRSQMPKRQSPLDMLSMSSQVRQAVGLDADRHYYGGRTQRVWAPESFGVARMAAYGWLLKFEQDQQQSESAENTESAENSLFDRLAKSAAEEDADRETLYDWMYLEQLRGKYDTIFQLAQRLAREGGKEEQRFYLSSLRLRNMNVQAQQVVRSSEQAAKKEPLRDDELELMLTCYEDLSEDGLSQEAMAAAYGGQVAYGSNGQMYVNVGGNWIAVSGSFGGQAFLGTIVEELKLAGREEQAEQLLTAEIAEAKTVRELSTAMNLLFEQERFDGLDELYPRWVSAAREAIAKAPATTGNRRASRQGARPLAMQSNLLIRWMGKLAPEEEHAHILAILDPALDLSIEEAKRRRANRPARRPTSSTRQNNNTYFRLMYGKENIQVQLDYPRPNEYVDHASLMLLREVFEVFQRNDVVSDLPAHLRKRVEASDPESLLYEELFLGYALWWSEEQEEAVVLLTRAAERLHDDPSFRLEMATLYERLGDVDKALEIVESITPRDQQLVRQRETMALLLAERLGDRERARQAAERLFGLRLDNDSQLALVERMRRLGLHEMAEAVVSRVHRRMGNQTGSLATLMALYQGQGKIALAEQIAHNILRRTTSPISAMANSARNPFRYRTSGDATRTQALRLLQQTGALQGVIERLESQLEQSPQSPRLYEQLIEFYQAAGARDKVEGLLVRGVAQRPEAHALRYQLAQHYEQTGKVKEACDHYLELLRQKPSWLAEDFYNVRRVFERAQRSIDLVKALETINLQSMGQPYYVVDLVGNLLQNRGGNQTSEEDTELALRLFERVFEAFPSYRNQLITRIHNEDLWKNERVYALAKRGVVPSAQEAAAQPWFGVNDIYSYSSGGQVSAMFHRLLNGIRGTDKVADLRKAIEEGLEQSPGWLGGEAMLALIDLKEDQKEAAKARLEKLVADDEVLKAMPSDTCWIVGQELDQFEDTRAIALRLFESAAANNQSMRQMQYSPISRLVKLYGSLNRKDDARDLLLKQLRRSPSDMHDQQYSSYMRIENSVWAGSQLLDLGFSVDAVRTYREVVDDREALQQAGQWYGNRPDYFANQAQSGLKRALDAIEEVDAENAMEQLLASPKQIADDKAILDLMLSAPDAKSLRKETLDSSLVKLLESISQNDEIARQVDVRLTALHEEHPQDFSVAVMQALHRQRSKDDRVDESLKRLVATTADQPLAEIPAGRRPNSRQRREALLQVPLWLVARECVTEPAKKQIGETLGKRALEAAQRQVGNEYFVAILFEWGQLAIEAGDRTTAEAKWSELLEAVTKRPERKERPARERPQVAPTPAANRLGGNRPAAQSAWPLPTALSWLTLLAAEEPPAATIPPLTISQFRLTIEVALVAAENDMPELSQRAVRAALAGGMPVADPVASTASGGRYAVATARLSAGTPQPEDVSATESEVASSLRRVLEKWQGDQYPAESVYELLHPVVMPASRPADILLYADSSKLRDAQTASLGAALVEWARKADQLADLERRIADRKKNPQSVVPALVLQTLIALGEQKAGTAKQHLTELAKNIEKGALPNMVQLACHAAIPASDHVELEDPAFAILQVAVQQQAQATAGNNDVTFGALVSKVNTHLAGEPEKVKEFYETFLVGRQAYYSRYGGDYGLYLQWRDWANIAEESAKAGVPAVALDFMGRVCDFTYRNNSRPSLTVSLATVCRELRGKSPRERYEAWSSWTLPTEGRQSVRILAEWVEPVTAPDAFLTANPERGVLHTGDLLCNLHELLDAAAEAGSLDELRDETKGAVDQKLPGSDILWPLIAIRMGDKETAAGAITDLIDTLPERSKRESNQPRPDLWGDYLVYRACMDSSEFAPLYEAGCDSLTFALRDHSQFQTLVRMDNQSLRRKALDCGAAIRPGADSGLLHWLAVSPRELTRGVKPSWIVQEGHVAHMPGPGVDTLCFAYPLTGEFDFSVDCFTGSWAETDAGYGGIIVESMSPGSRVAVTPLSGHESLTRPKPLKHYGFNRVVIRVADGKLRYFLNGRLVYEEAAGPTSPWLTLYSFGPRKTTFRNLAITGRPIIPRQVELVSDDRLDGWNCTFFGESQPRHRLMAEKAKSENDRVAYEQGREPAEPDWRSSDGVLLGKPASEPGDQRQSWIYYHRPLCDRETFSYEFHYTPDSSAAYPTLGRLAFLIEPEGVDVHWIARPDWDEAVLGIASDNRVTEPECRRGPAELPLKPNDWNQVEVTLRGDQVVIALNGTEIYERPLEAQNNRLFGIFRHKRQAAKVRHARLAGPWPDELTDELRKNLIATRAEFSDADRRVINQILTDECFEHDTVAVVDQARALHEEESLAFLERWVLPSPERANFRLYYRHAPAASSGSADGDELLSPALELVEVAARLDRLGELRDRIDGMKTENIVDQRNKLALTAVVAMRMGDDDSARNSMAELYDLLGKHVPKTLARRDRAAEYVVAWQAAERPALRYAALDLARRLQAMDRDKETSSGDTEWRRDLDVLIGRTGSAIVDSAEGAHTTAETKLTQWHSVAWRHRDLQANGRRPTQWRARRGMAQHQPGGIATQLVFQSPLQGEFEILAEQSTDEYREAAVAYGRHAAAPRHDLKAKRLTTLPYAVKNSTAELEIPNWGSVADVRIAVDGPKVTTFTNGVQIHEEVLAPQPDPWVVLQASSAGYDSTVRNVRIVGKPEIAAEIDLIDIAGWAGWKTDLYGESISPDGANEDAVWRHVGEEIVGQLRENLSARPIESLLAYQRPMLEDGTIEFESYYAPGQFEIHPAIGLAAFLVRPDGVTLHTLTAAEWETSELQPDNESKLKGAAQSVPLRENDWNQFHLEVRGDTLTIIVNSQKVAEVQLTEPPAERFFGLFRYADQTKCRVRKLVYRGDWPTELPGVADQELAYPTGNSHLDLANAPRVVEAALVKSAEEMEANGIFVEEASGVKVTDVGTEITADAATERTSSPGLVVRRRFEGECDFVLDFDKLQLAPSTEDAVLGFAFRVIFDSPDEVWAESAILSTPEGKQRLRATIGHRGLDGSQQTEARHLQGKWQSGRLRIIRREGEVHYLFAAQDAEKFRLLASFPVGSIPVSELRIEALPPGGEAAANGDAPAVSVLAQKLTLKSQDSSDSGDESGGD